MARESEAAFERRVLIAPTDGGLIRLPNMKKVDTGDAHAGREAA